MIYKFLFLASIILLTSCFWESPPDYYVKIINKSEYNITRVIVVFTKTEKVVIDEKDNQLIVKNGGSKSFNVGNDASDFIACVEADNTLEPICTIILDWNKTGGEKSITWNGPNSSGWLPATSFPSCPKIFSQCNSESKYE